jgi:ABC-type transport system substrate-binding protein
MKYQKRHNSWINIVLITILSSCIVFAGTVTASEKYVWEKWDYLGTPKKGGDYKIAATIDVGLLNPHHWPVMDWNVIDMLMEQVVVAAEGAIMRPWLTESWKFRDPLTLEVKYKKGITFHDGTPLNAEAIKYNFEWVLEKKNGAWTRSYILAMKSIEVLDEYTVLFHFKKPFAIFISQMQTPVSYTLSPKSLGGDRALIEANSLKKKIKGSKKKLAKLEKKGKKEANKGKSTKKTDKKIKKAKKALAKLEKKYAKAAKKAEGIRLTDQYPVGTGPYMYDDRSSGNWIKLKRNPNYWYAKKIGRDMPYFDTVKYEIIPDRSVQLANLRVGKIHQMDLGPAMYKMLAGKPDQQVQVDAMSMPHTETMIFNNAKGPAKDIRVRKAVAHAIDRKALLHGARFGLGVLASGLFPSDLWHHNPNLKPTEYKPELSKQLLKEAGYDGQLNLKGHVSNNPEALTVASIIKNMLSKVGIIWSYDVLDATAASDRNVNLEFDLYLSLQLYIFDPDQQVTVMYHPDGANFGRNNIKEAVALVDAGKAEYDFNKRQQIYWNLEKVLRDNYVDIYLWHPKVGRAFHKSVRGTDAKMAEKYLDAWKRSHFLSALWFEK